MRLTTLKYDSIDFDDSNSPKVEARVPLEVVEEFFQQRLLVKDDVRHSVSEERFIAMGYTKDPKRCLVVAYTMRVKGTETLIRPISARYTHKKEQEAYEEQIKDLEKK